MRWPSRQIAMFRAPQSAATSRPGSPRGAVACVAQAALVAILAAGATGCVGVRVDTDGVRVREEKRFTTKGRTTVQLATFDGAIVIRGWDRDEISVEIEKRGRDKAAAEAIEVLASQKGDVVVVEARKKDMADGKSYQIGWNGVSRSAKLIVSVPTGSDLIVRTGDGSIRVDHVHGKLELRSSDGSVTGRDLTGDVVAHTDDGAIRLEGVDGKCDVASDDGSIVVQGRLEGLRVSTEDGSVVVRAAAGSKIARDWNLSTGDGSMVLYLADGLGADLDAEARDGSVKLDSGLAFEHESGDRSRGTVRGRLGAGGPRLVMRSGDGTIRLRRLPGGPPAPPPPPPPAPPDLPVER